MPLKKTLLSIVMLALFSSYALYERAHGDSAGLVTLAMRDLSGAQSDLAAVNTTPQQPARQSAQSFTPQNPPSQTRTQTQPAIARSRGEDDDSYSYDEEGEGSYTPARQPQTTPAQPVQTAPQPQPTPTPTPAPQPVAKPTGQYKDGAYTGPSVYVYYGNVQVQAVVQGGKLADVKFLQYPSDRSTSRYINSQAMPMLTQEAVAAQSAQVDGVSGASATSQGFIQSLSSALSQAHV
jgi:uncharacterized protein with FMN-binding domain